MKIIQLIAVLLAIATNINAQIRWGVKVGGNLSEMAISENKVEQIGNKIRLGFHVAGVMEYSLNSSLFIQPELMFVQGGTGFKNATTKGHINISQIQVPVNVKYSIGTNGVKLFFTAGTYVGYGISGEFKYSNSNNKVDIYSDQATGSERFKRFILGVAGGMGVEINRITIGLSYQHSINNLSKSENVTALMGAFMFSAGYFF